MIREEKWHEMGSRGIVFGNYPGKSAVDEDSISGEVGRSRGQAESNRVRQEVLSQAAIESRDA